mgnify:CR=1 FL=1
MKEERKIEARPYRTAGLLKMAAEIGRVITSGEYTFPPPTFEECLLALDVVREAIEKTKEDT